MIVYFDSSRGISAGLALGALLDAGADAALVQRILGTAGLGVIRDVVQALFRIGVEAVDGFGKQPSRGGFAGAARAAKQISVANTPGLERVAQSPGNVLLADHFVERRWPPL